jgi:hypothetical protein
MFKGKSLRDLEKLSKLATEQLIKTTDISISIKEAIDERPY